ncbi:MAG: 2TM domain-containing protein [Bacteroidia bacterium]|nr:2TM domain-containing protein [Bacteroidia bacterium]
MKVLLVIFTVHFLADFVFQSSKMATGKSKSLKWLSIHVGVYGLVSLISMGVLAYVTKDLYWSFVWWGLNVVLHFFVDYFTSKITSKFWEQKNMRLFFVMIGFDQLLHNLCLIVSCYIMMTFAIAG